MSILDDNMVWAGGADPPFPKADESEKFRFQSSDYIFITLGLLILACNTWYALKGNPHAHLADVEVIRYSYRSASGHRYKCCQEMIHFTIVEWPSDF